MPLRKRLLVAAAGVAGAALLVAGALAIRGGQVTLGVAVIIATCAASVLALQTYWVRCDLSGESLRAGRRRGRQIALTFDDGPGPDTLAVLEALESVGVRATFFVLGIAAAARPDLVREIARHGHLVAPHGHTHRKLHFASPRRVAFEIDSAVAAIRAAGVDPAPFFRAPHGFKGPLLLRALRRRKLRLVGFTRGVWDTDRPGVEVIAGRACRRMRGGHILLLHDGCATSGLDPRRNQTAAAVPEIARRWRAAGYEFVTIDQFESAQGRGARVRALRFLGLAILVALTCLGGRSIDLRALKLAFADAVPSLLFAAASANVLALVMQTGRWLSIVHPIEPQARLRDGFFSLTAGYAVGLVVPARASDLVRAHLLARRSGASTAALAATAVVDHLLGAVALFALVGLAAAASGLPGWLRSAGTLAFPTAGGMLVALWFLRPRGGERDQVSGLGGVLARLRRGLTAVGRPRVLVVSWLFALGGWASEVLIASLSLRAFGIASGVETSLLVVLATTLSAAISISPGNAGSFELACMLALSEVGVNREPALAFAVGYHAVHLIPVGILGGGWLFANGYRGSLAREAP